MTRLDLPIHESYKCKDKTDEPLMYEHLSSKEFIDAMLEESTEPVALNEVFPFLAPILATVGPKLASFGANLYKSGAIKRGVKAAGQALAQNVDGRNLIAAAKLAARSAGKAFTPEVLSQLIAALASGDTGQNAQNANNDQNVTKVMQAMMNGNGQQGNG